MNKQPSEAMIERMEFVNCLNRELNRKVFKCGGRT